MRRAWLIVPAVALAVPVGLAVAAGALLNGDAVRVRLQEQVRRATGRELTVAGPVRLAWSLSPTVELQDVSLANPPGFSRPTMAHVEAIAVQVGLLGLLSHRIDVQSVLLAAPEVRLERDAQGRANWDFSRPAGPPAGAPSPSGGGERFAVTLGRVEVRDAAVAWSGGSLSVPRLGYDRRDGQVRGELVARGVPFALSGAMGPIAGPAWPLALRLAGGGLDASVSGTTDAARIEVAAPDLAAASALVQSSLPPLHDLRVAATLGPDGLHELRGELGATAFGPLAVSRLSLAAPSWTSPAAVTGTASLGALPLGIEGQLGPLSTLASGAATPVALRAKAADAELDATGSVAAAGPATLALSGHAADLAALGAAAQLGLPRLHDLLLATTLTLSAGEAALAGLQATSAEGDLSGALTIATAGRLAVTGSLSSTRLDLAALAPAPPPAQPAASPPPPQPPPQQPPQPSAARAIPDVRLPFEALRRADLALTWRAGEASWRGRVAHDVALDLSLQDGRLAVRQSGIGFGDKRLTLDGTADAASRRVSAKLAGAGLPAGAALALVGAAAEGGTLDLRADLAGTGDTLRAVLASLTGTAGLSLVDAEIDNAWLQGLLAAARLPIEAGGRSRVRCAALAVEAQAGVVTLRALSLDSTRLRLDGEGRANLADETLDLRLSPQLRLGTALSVPVRLRGTFMAPKVALDAGAIAPGRVGIVLGGAPPADTCGPALAVARAGAPGPEPAPLAEPAPKPAKPADLLRSLLR